MARTTNELRQVLKQWLAAKRGTKPFKGTVKTGFLTGGSVKKSELSEKQLATRSRLKARIMQVKKSTRNKPKTDRQTQYHGQSNLPPNTNPGPVPPKPSNFPSGGPVTTPPTKPATQRGSVTASSTARVTALKKKLTK